MIAAAFVVSYGVIDNGARTAEWGMIYYGNVVNGRELIYRMNMAACAGRGETAFFVA
jgi:hypothetical protein